MFKQKMLTLLFSACLITPTYSWNMAAAVVHSAAAGIFCAGHMLAVKSAIKDHKILMLQRKLHGLQSRLTVPIKLLPQERPGYYAVLRKYQEDLRSYGLPPLTEQELHQLTLAQFSKRLLNYSLTKWRIFYSLQLVTGWSMQAFGIVGIMLCPGTVFDIFSE